MENLWARFHALNAATRGGESREIWRGLEQRSASPAPADAVGIHQGPDEPHEIRLPGEAVLGEHALDVGARGARGQSASRRVAG